MSTFLLGENADDSNIRRGEAANFGQLRSCIMAGSEEGIKIAQEQLDSEDVQLIESLSTLSPLPSSSSQKRLKSLLFPVQVSLIGSSNGKDDYDEVSGYVGVTSKQLMFMAVTRNDDATVLEMQKYDISADAKCIHLHAISQHPTASVYVQIQNVAEEIQPIELTIIPEKEELCEELFDALSRLISLHPISPDDEQEDGDYDSGMVWAATDDSSSVGATEEERAAMLDRLDNLLIIKPELEIHEDDGRSCDADGHGAGQFDDADGDVDIL